MNVVETERLYSRAWKESDIETLAEMNADPEVMRFFPKTYTKEESKGFISRMQKLYSVKSYAYLPCFIKENDEMIGWVGLCDQDIIGLSMVDIGWRLKRSSWGNGYASELAKGFIEKGFTDFGLEKIYAIAPSINTPSIGVMQKVGMIHERSFRHPLLKDYPRVEKCELYSIIKH